MLVHRSRLPLIDVCLSLLLSAAAVLFDYRLIIYISYFTSYAQSWVFVNLSSLGLIEP